MANKKYAVWVRNFEEESKEYIYAGTHRGASVKYRKTRDVPIRDIETRKV